MNQDPYADIDVKVAKYDGVCCFCGKRTKAHASVTWLRATRRNSFGMTKRERRVAHTACYESGGNIVNYRG